MKYCYDLHIHSALSPCCEDDCTPVNILTTAAAMGLEIIAVSDHNAIFNVEAAMEIGEALDILVVPAMELQTNEDIHLLCLFESYKDLEDFYKSLRFPDIKNRPDIFGRQLIVDSDDNIVGEFPDYLLSSCDKSEYEIFHTINKYNGIAIPAHIDREGNGMLNILGDIPSYYKTVEMSPSASLVDIESYEKKYNLIIDSDAHCLEKIGNARHFVNLTEKTAKALINYLKHVKNSQNS